MNKRFLTAMLGIGLVLGMAALVLTGCETEASTSALNKGRTIVLTGGVPAGVIKAEVFANSADIKTATPVGGGAAKSTGGSDVTISVQPYGGSFSADTYQITIEADGTLKSAYGDFKASEVELDWGTMNPISAAKPSYGISLSESGVYQFTSDEGAEPPAALSVNVTNTGTQATGVLTVTISGRNPDSFTLSTDTIDSIAPNASTAFSVQPEGGLDAGVYDATVTVKSSSNNIQASFAVRFTVTKPEEKPMYGISLSRNGEHNFGTVYEGYELPAVLSVNVTNTGKQETGVLTVTISGLTPDSFTLSTDTIDSIAPNASTAFSVRPNSKLPEHEYRATVTVKSSSNDIQDSFTVKFTVTKPGVPEPTYGIRLSESGEYPFTSDEGAEPPAALWVDVTNTGNQATGPLTVTISGPNHAAFTLNPTAIDSIAVGGNKTDAFSVRPKVGRAAGEYFATVTVTGSNGIKEEFAVKFTVATTTPEPEEEKPMYGISLNPSGVHQFLPSVVPGYEDEDIPSALSVTVTNKGKQPTGELTVSVSDPAAFTLNPTAIDSIAVGGNKTDAFSVRPKGGLGVGGHVAIVTVTGANSIYAEFTVRFTVDTTTKTATVPDEVKWEGNITKVTYEGDKPLTGENNTDFVVPSGKTLIITGPIEGQAAEIKKANATSTVTNNGTIKTATTAKNVLANLVGISTTSNGKVVLTGAVTDVTAPLALGANLEIGAGGSITYTNTANAAFSATEPKTVTILSENTGTALTLPGSITGYGDKVTVSNKSPTAIILTNATSVEALTAIIAAKRNITASGNVTVTGNATLEIPADVTLTNTGTLTIVDNAKLIVIGTLTNNGILNNLSGIIEVSTATKLVEVLKLDGLNGKVTVNKQPSVTLLSDAIVPINVELLVPSGQTLSVSEVTLTVNGKLTCDGSLVVDVDGSLVVDDAGRVVVGATGNVTVNGSNSIGLIDVTALYPLSTVADVNPAAFKENGNYTAVRNIATTGDDAGLVTITLKGEAGTTIANETVYNTMFGSAGNADNVLRADKVSAGYSAVEIGGLLVAGTAKIVQYNQGFNMWISNASGHSDFITDWDKDNVCKTRTYASIPANDTFDIILWGGATRKTITLEITQPYSDDGNADNDGPTQKFLIDYTAVTFTP